MSELATPGLLSNFYGFLFPCSEVNMSGKEFRLPAIAHRFALQYEQKVTDSIVTLPIFLQGKFRRTKDLGFRRDCDLPF